MNCEADKKPLVINPYVFQHNDLALYEREENGDYVARRDFIVRLGVRPRSPAKGVSPGCAGDGFVLSEDGDLYIMKGCRMNGPNLLDDAACRMLGAFVHDLLCSKAAVGQYSYWQKNKFYGDIVAAQGEKKWFAKASFWGLIIGNWAVTPLRAKKAGGSR